MTDNKDKLFPDDSFSVDDILKEVRAMKLGLSSDTVPADTAMPKITPSEHNAPEQAAEPSAIQTPEKVAEPIQPTATEAPLSHGDEKLKKFFAKTKSSDFTEDAETAKSQIDALFGDDPNAVIRPFEKKRHKNSNILSAEEINGTRAETPAEKPVEIPTEQSFSKAVQKSAADTIGIDFATIQREMSEKIRDIPLDKTIKSTGFHVKTDDEPTNAPANEPIDASADITVAPQKSTAVKTAMDVDSLFSLEQAAPTPTTAPEKTVVFSVPEPSKAAAPMPATPEPQHHKINIQSVFTEEQPEMQDTPMADKLFSEIGGIGTGFEKVRRRPLHTPQISSEPIKSAEEQSDIIDDYRTIEDAESIRIDLRERSSRLSKRIFATLLTFILSGVLTLLPPLGVELPAAFSPLLSPKTYLIAAAVAFALTVLVNFTSIMRGLFSLIRLKADIDTAVSVASVVAAVQLVFAITDPTAISERGVCLYTAAASLSMLFNLIGKRCMLARVRSNFELVATAGVKQSCFAASDESSLILANGSVIGQPVIACSKSVINLHNYLQNSFCEDPADSMCQILAPVGLIVALVSGGISYFMTQSVITALTAAAAITSACVPLTSLLATNLPLFSASKRVREHGGMISGYNAVEEFSDAECAVIDSDELFPAGSIDLLSLKAIGDASVDGVILDAASLCITAGGPLADVFDRMIEGKRKMLKPAENVFYEDELGLSGIVDKRNIKLGNRRYMEQNGVHPLPDIELEARIGRNNCFAVYLCVENELCGMFIVKYTASDEDSCEQLRRLCNAGITMLIKTCDPNITPKLIESVFGIPAEYVKVLPSYAVLEYERICAPQENGDSILSYNNTTTAFCAGLVAAKRLRFNVLMATIIQSVGVILGFGAATFFALTGDFALLTPVIIVGYQLACAVLTLLIPRLRRV